MRYRPLFRGKFLPGGITEYRSLTSGRVYQIVPVGFERREKTYIVSGNGELLSPCVLPIRGILHLIELDDVF